MHHCLGSTIAALFVLSLQNVEYCVCSHRESATSEHFVMAAKTIVAVRHAQRNVLTILQVLATPHDRVIDRDTILSPRPVKPGKSKDEHCCWGREEVRHQAPMGLESPLMQQPVRLDENTVGAMVNSTTKSGLDNDSCETCEFLVLTTTCAPGRDERCPQARLAVKYRSTRPAGRLDEHIAASTDRLAPRT